MSYYQKLSNWLTQHKPELNYTYQVPLLGEGGTCSLFGELDPKPFSLQQHLTATELELVSTAQSICDWIQSNTSVDWFGIYLLRDNNGQPVLTKLAYFGAPSRAEFPVNEDFAQISNNSSVALTGVGRTINDVESYINEGGEYYTCDPKVKSELCWPIIQHNSDDDSAKGKILGIIDAECFSTQCFDQEQESLYADVCQLLAERFSN